MKLKYYFNFFFVLIFLCQEERFLYPIYPLLAFMGAYSLSTMIDVICDIIAELHREDNQGEDSSSTVTSSSTSSSTSIEESAPNMNNSVELKIKIAKKSMTGASILVAFLLFSSRSISNFINFGGQCFQLLFYASNLLFNNLIDDIIFLKTGFHDQRHLLLILCFSRI